MGGAKEAARRAGGIGSRPSVHDVTREIERHLGLNFETPLGLFWVVNNENAEFLSGDGFRGTRRTFKGSEFEEAIGSSNRPGGVSWLPSLISPSQAQPTPNSRVMVVDFGGTHTKVAVRYVDAQGNETWRLVCDVDNKQSNMYVGGQEGEKKLTIFCENLAKAVKDAVPEEDNFNGVAVIWSNAAKAVNTPDDGSGTNWVGAVVADKHATYRKGEPYVDDLVDGDKLHTLVAAGLSRHIGFRNLVCGNDTVFTSLAVPGSSAGIVSSTGVNSTGTFNRQTYNLESGGRWLVRPEFLGAAEKKRYPYGISVQDLIGGGEMFLPATFKLHLHELTRNDAPFSGVLLGLEDGAPPFSAAGISKFANLDISHEGALADNIRHHVARLLHHRAGYLLAQLAYLSVWNQVNEQNSGTTGAQTFPIAIDSTLLRGSAVCQESFEKAIGVLNQSISPYAVTYQILQPLVCSEGQISVPTLGAAASLDGILQKSS